MGCPGGCRYHLPGFHFTNRITGSNVRLGTEMPVGCFRDAELLAGGAALRLAGWLGAACADS